MSVLNDLIAFGDAESQDKRYSDALVYYGFAIDLFYEKAAEYFKVKPEEVRSLPQEKLVEFFSKDEVFSRLVTQKGIASMNVGDLSLAGRMFEDAIFMLPKDSKFVDCYFYLSVVQYMSGFGHHALANFKQAVLIEPGLISRLDGLSAPIEQVLTPDFKKSFQALAAS